MISRLSGLLLIAISLLCGCTSNRPLLLQDAGPREVHRLDPYSRISRPINTALNAAFSEAKQMMVDSRWIEAEQVLLGLAEDNPQLSGPLLNLAIVYEHQNDEERAEIFYEKAKEANSQNLHALNRYAIFLRGQGRFEEAEKLYQQALEIWNADAATHRNLAILYDLYMGRLTDALQHYEAYLNLVAAADSDVQSWVVDLQMRISRQRKTVADAVQ